MQFESFFEIGQCLFFGFTLAGDIYLQALRHVPVAFTPDGAAKGRFMPSLFHKDGCKILERQWG